MAEFHIFVVSDGTGETATKISKAALLQFKSANTKITRHSNVRSIEAIRDIVKESENSRALIVHTFVSRQLRTSMEEICEDRNVPRLDLLGPLLEKLEQFVGMAPMEKPG